MNGARAAANPHAALLALALALALAPATAQSVGMPGRIESLVLEGSELEVAPLAHDTPLSVRIAASYPHGSAFRYDFVYQGYVAGKHDLRTFLRRKDGSSTADLPPIPVAITALTGDDTWRPNELGIRQLRNLGGYRTWMWVAGIGWVLGLVAIVWFGRRRRSTAAALAPPPITLADRLRPLVAEVLAGRQSRERLAELERLLLSCWRRRLDLERVPAAEAIAALRRHPDAGLLLRQLEDWLHRPAAPDGSRTPVDVPALLRPYQDLPADSADAPGAPTHAPTGPAGGVA
jgi:hypothetical protein